MDNKDVLRYKGLKSNFEELGSMVLKNTKSLTISKKINPVTKNEQVSLAQSITVTDSNGKEMQIFLKNALTLEKHEAKKVALIILSNF